MNFLERLDDRIRCTHKETVAVENCVFSEKPADRSNVFKLEISIVTDF